MSYRLTYSTMFNPPEELHTRFEAALKEVRASLGQRHPMFINGCDELAARSEEKKSPIDTGLVLGSFPAATAQDAARAVAAAKAAFPIWRKTPPAQRVALMRRVAELIEERVYHIAAALTLEVGKNRMEALGEVQETADFFRIYGEDFAKQQHFDHVLPDDPLPDFKSHNRSVMKPYGVWVVIAPFNFPFALAGGPVAAALVTGNTVVMKSSVDTPWSSRMLADCLRDAGLPPGVFNFLNGSGREVGSALVEHPDTAGITFTGSYGVGMDILRKMMGGRYPRPCIVEMGGKNAVIVTRSADLDRAALGIMRSAFGMGGQKCSALSRIYVEEQVADRLVEKLTANMGQLRIGDPTARANYLGPVVNGRAYEDYARYVEALGRDGSRILVGGKLLKEGELARGYYVAPTLAETPLTHPLWKEEMFLPIAMLARVKDREEAMRLANDSELGLTAGVFGSTEDVAWFHDNIEAGVTYANRPQGATTGAWPGYQPFGGWKGSGSSGKAGGGLYYVQQFMREQSQTVVS